MKAIMFSNGLNLLNGYTTWNDLIQRIDDRDDRQKIPNTLHYETQILKQPYKMTETTTIKGEPLTYNVETVKFTIGVENSFKNGVAHNMHQYKSNDVYRRMTSLNDVEHYLTTNYDQVLKQTLLAMGF